MPSRKEPVGPVLYRISVPPNERQLIDGTPEEYLVVEREQVCCLIYGRYGGLWHCNVSARWLVRHLLEMRPGVTAVAGEVGRTR